jgi:hypothetical protein
LGYCGNDFAQVRNLDVNILDELETLTLQVGKWLASMGYLGAFGLDAIEYRRQVYLVEVNPRFQGSSLMAAQLDEELGRSDIFLNHVAAYFGISAPSYVPLRELAKQQRGISQIYCYNRNRQPVFRQDTVRYKHQGIDLTHLTALDVAIDHEGMLFKAVVEGRVSTNGHTLLPEYGNRISEAIEAFTPQPPT